MKNLEKLQESQQKEQEYFAKLSAEWNSVQQRILKRAGYIEAIIEMGAEDDNSNTRKK